MLGDSCEAIRLVNGEVHEIEVCYRNQYHLNGENGYPMPLPHTLKVGNAFSRASREVSEYLTAEFFKRYHGIVELLIFIHEDLLVATLSNDQTGISPTEVVHAPE